MCKIKKYIKITINKLLNYIPKNLNNLLSLNLSAKV